MLPLTLSNFLLYSALVWGSNIMLNLLGIIKQYIPRVKKLDPPLDFSLCYKGERLLGNSTTFWGLFLSLIASTILIFQDPFFIWSIPLLVYLGHALGSFIKRRLHKAGGEFVPLVDHGDYTIVTGVVLWLAGCVPPTLALWSIIITYIIHPVVCFLAFRLRLRERPY
jgi:hypothetical protein